MTPHDADLAARVVLRRHALAGIAKIEEACAQTKEPELSTQHRALIDMGTLVMQSAKPETFVELHKLLWDAFHLGQIYGKGS